MKRNYKNITVIIKTKKLRKLKNGGNYQCSTKRIMVIKIARRKK